MTTPRRITCCILSVLALASCGVVSKDLPLRTVRVQALGDPALRERNPRWDEEVRGLIEASSDYFDNEFGVRFVVQSTAAWPAQEKIASTAGLMVRLKKEFPLDGKREAYDLLIAFTGERVNIYNGGRGRVDRIGDCREGLGNYVVLYVSAPFRYTGATTEPTIDVIALIHELGHIFGAEHVQDSQSIMAENFDYRSTFDMKNRSVILKNRLCPFAR
jgi:hypothetical protein